MSTSLIRYNLMTHSSFSHTYVVNILSSLEAEYRFQKIENEENYSQFEVYSTNETFQRVRDMVEQNNGTAITIQYGTY
jgi:hypothetical protein